MTLMQQMLKQGWSQPHSDLILLHDRDIGNAEIKAKAVNEARIMNFYSCKLCLAKFANNMILLHLLILSDICIAVNNFEETPIYSAAQYGTVWDNPNAPVNIGYTPIYWAAMLGHTEIVKILAPFVDNPHLCGDVVKQVLNNLRS